MHLSLIILNLVASLASAFAAVIALVRPASLSGSTHVSSGEAFYVRMYAARAVPFELTTGLLPFWFGGPAVACVLFTAAATQLADVAIAARKGERGMIVGATIGAMAHLLCGLAVIYGAGRAPFATPLSC